MLPRQPAVRPAIALDGDSPAGHHLHLRHHRRLQGRHPHAQQLRGQRPQPARLLADHRRRPLPAGAAAVPRPWARQRPALLAARAAAACACWSASSIRKPPPSFSISAPRCSSACPPSMCACWRRRGEPRAKSAASCGCSFPARRRCRRRCWKSFARCSATRFWNATG